MNKNTTKTDGATKKRRATQPTKKTTKPRAARRGAVLAPAVDESADAPVAAVASAAAPEVAEVASRSTSQATATALVVAPASKADAPGDETARAAGRGRGRGRRGGRGRGRGRRGAEDDAASESTETKFPAGEEVHPTPEPPQPRSQASALSPSPIDAPVSEPFGDADAEDLPFGFGLTAEQIADRAAARRASTEPVSTARSSVVPSAPIARREVPPPMQRPIARPTMVPPSINEARTAPRDSSPPAKPMPTPHVRRDPIAPPRPPLTPPPKQETTPDGRANRRDNGRRDRGGSTHQDRDRHPRRGAPPRPAEQAPVRPTDDDEPANERIERFTDDERPDSPFQELDTDRDDDLFPEVAQMTPADTEAEAEKELERRGAGRRRRGRRPRGRGPDTDEAPIDELDDEAPTRVEPDEPDTDEEPESFDDEVEDEPLPADYKWVEAKLDRPKPREMVINVSGQDECRIAILQNGRLEELFIERTSSQSHVGNIYKGKVTNVEPSIQAAFIDFGLPKNGFLHISDVQPQYFPNHTGAGEDVGRKIPRHHRPPIQKCFRRGQEVIVQITKEGVGTKGPTLTTYLSMPGRFLVMMPGMNRHGVSRKIEDEQARRNMRDVLNQLTFPPGMGFILRTAGMDRNKRELQRDLHYLMRLWKRVVDRVKKNASPAELYRESDLITRTIRDCYTADFDRVIVDDTEAARKVSEFLRVAMPRSRPPVELYTSKEPMFHRLGIEEEIERINARHVPLRSGGSLVIDSTEALVAIDVNSGRFRSLDDAEETALRINLEASDEIARQLRLRDLGGLIVCDFIDMRLERNRRKVERALRDALKDHKERARCLRMSAFGLIEMTRQRQGPSMKRNIYSDCVHCRGSGLVKMPESVVLDVMRHIQLGAYDERVRKVTVTVSNDMAYQILNTRRAAISRVETETSATILIRGDANFTTDQIECVYEDGRGQPVPIGGV